MNVRICLKVAVPANETLEKLVLFRALWAARKVTGRLGIKVDIGDGCAERV